MKKAIRKFTRKQRSASRLTTSPQVGVQQGDETAVNPMKMEAAKVPPRTTKYLAGLQLGVNGTVTVPAKRLITKIDLMVFNLVKSNGGKPFGVGDYELTHTCKKSG